MADVTIRFRGDSKEAIRAIDQLQSEVSELGGHLTRTRQQMGMTTTEVQKLGRSLGDVDAPTRVLTGSLGKMGGFLAGLGLVHAARRVAQFGAASLKAAGELNGMVRGLEDAYGSSEIATRRFSEFVELAKTPGLAIPQLTTYDAILKNIGNTAGENNVIFTGLAKGITTYGGSVHDVTGALHQLQQAMDGNRIVSQDFRPLLERTRGSFLAVAKTVHGFTGGIDEMRASWQASGSTLKEYLLPIFERMNQRFAGAPVDSYTNKMGNLEDAFGLLQAAIGQKLLPAFDSISDSILDVIENTTKAIEGFEDLTDSIYSVTEAFSNRQSVVDHIEDLRRLRDEQQQLADENAPGILGINFNQEAFDTATQNVEELNAAIKLYEEAIAGVPGSEQALQQAIDTTAAALKERKNAYVESLSALKSERDANSLFVDDATKLVLNIESEIEALESKQKTLTSVQAALDTYRESQSAASEEGTQEAAVYRDITRELDTLKDTLETYQKALEDAETPKDAAAAHQGIIDTLTALQTLQQGRAEDLGDARAYYAAHRSFVEGQKQAAEDLAKAEERFSKRTQQQRERSRKERIASAKRARDVEVAANEAAAASGEAYAEQLERLETASQRERFIQIVESFQAQGLSFDEAREKAEPYIDVIAGIPGTITDADAALGRFNSNLVRDVDQSADAVVNLSRAVTALGRSLNESLPDTAGSLERSLLNEQRYFENTSTGRTLDDIQREAGEDGLAFLKSFERGREFLDDYKDGVHAAADETEGLKRIAKELDAVTLDNLVGEFSRLDGAVGDISTKIGQFDIQGLASGNPASIATLPFQLYNAFTFDQRQADARLPELDRKNREAYERGEFGIPTDLLDFGRGRVQQAIGLTDDPQLQALLGGLNPVIGKTGLDEVANIPERIREAIQSYTDRALEALQEELNESAFNLNFARQTGGDVQGALNDVISANTAFYQEQIDSYNLQRQALGYAVGNVEELNRRINELNNEARLELAPLASSTRYNVYQRYLTTRDQPTQEEIDAEYASTFTEGDPNAQFSFRAGDGRPEAPTAETLENVIASINDDIGLINASITSIETQIGQASEPAEIAALLERIPELIATKYQRLRDRLDAQYNADEISVDAYNASLTELESSESREVEAHSDAVLANTVRAINEDVQLINASITSIETQISQTSEPDEIIALLSQIPERITQKYQRLRDALDAKYAAGEISVDVYNASLMALGSSEAADIERQSDAVLAQTIGEIDDNVKLIDADIGALQLTISQTDDPEVIAGLLEAIKALVMDKYKQLRERLDALYAAEEISTTAYNASLTALGTAESTQLANIDAQEFQAISTAAQKQVALINSSIENLRLSLQLTDDPEDIQDILEAIKVLTARRFDVLIQELKDIEESLDPEQFDTALRGLELGKQVSLKNIDTEKFSAISAEAQKQVDFKNGAIENLRLSFQLTDDPEKQQQILEAIKVLTAQRFQVLREELIAIRDTLKPEEFKQALEGINLGEQLSLKNIDTEKFAVISADAQRQVDFINGDIENLRLSLQLTDDPEDQQAIIEAIKVLTASRFRVLREELEKIKDSLDPEVYNQALKGLNLGEQLAIQNLDTEKFSLISAAAQKQVDAINGDIENLRLSFELADSPEDQQDIIEAIKVLITSRFRVLREELEKIKDSLDDEEYERALKGLNLGEQVALKKSGSEKFDIISAAAQKQADFYSGSIDNLRLALQLTDDPEEVQDILNSIKLLTAARFDVLIQGLKDIEDSFDDPAVFRQALHGLELGKKVAVRGIDNESIGVTLTGIGNQISETDSEITQLFDELGEQTTTAGVREAIGRLRTAITTKFQLMRDKINESAETEEEKAKQIAAVDFKEEQALGQLGERGLGQFNSLVDTAQFLLDNASESKFATRRQALITAIKTFYDERIKFINGLDLSDTDRTNMLQVARIQRNIALDAVPEMHESVTERLKMEEDLQKEIEDLRDARIENEEDRLGKLADLQEDHNQRMLALEEQFQEDLDDLRRDRNQTGADIQREYQRDLQDLQTETARRLFDEEFGDLTADQRSRLAEDDTYQRELFDLNRQLNRDVQDFQTEFGILTPASSGYDFYRQELESGALTDENLIERLFGRRGLDEYLQNQRSVADLEARTAERTADIEAEAQATAAALSAALAPLLQPESDTGRVSSDAAVASKDAATAANDAAVASRDAATAANAAVGTLPDIVGPLERIETASERFSDIVDAIGAPAADLRATVEGLSHLDLRELTRAVGNFNLLSDGLRETFEFVFSRASDAGAGPVAETELKDVLANALDSEAFGITLSPETESTLAAAVSQGDPAEGLDMGLAVDPSALTAKIEDAISVFAEPTPPSGLTADTISVSGNTVHVSGGLALPTGAPAAAPPQTIEVTVPVTLNDNILLEQQSRTEQLNERVNI